MRRYVGNWLKWPLYLDADLRRTKEVMSKLSQKLTYSELNAMLKGSYNFAWGWDREFCERRCLRPSHAWRTYRLLGDYSLDHIIPVSRGGKHHPENYFLMPQQVNNYFGNSWTAEKVAYIGLDAALAAGRLRWHGMKLPASVACGSTQLASRSQVGRACEQRSN